MCLRTERTTKRTLCATMPKAHVTEGIHPDQLFEVGNSYDFGDQPHQWWETVERSWWKSSSLTSTRWIRVCTCFVSCGDDPCKMTILVIPETSRGSSTVGGRPRSLCGVVYSLRSSITCLRPKKEKLPRGKPDLSCQINVGQQCMPTPTVGQIRKGNQCFFFFAQRCKCVEVRATKTL